MNTKTAITAAFIAITATTATAEEQSPVEVCGQWGQWADVVMWQRQSGTPLSTVVNEYKPAPTPYQMSVIMAAYDTPRFRTPSIVQDTIEDFRNEVELSCFKSFE